MVSIHMVSQREIENRIEGPEQGRVIFERNGDLGLVRLSRPKALNTITPSMMEELGTIVDAAAEEKTLKGIIISGEGGHFAAGIDVTLILNADAGSIRRAADKGRDVLNRVAGMPIPVVAAIEGSCIGGGFELALACHMRFAHHEATFALPEVKLGLIPGFGGTQRLPRLVGMADALGLILSGEKIKATHAARIGIVDRLCDGNPVEEAVDFMSTIANGSPLALRAAFRAIKDGVRLSLEDGLALEGQVFGEIIDSTDLLEGVKAFMEKRSPNFKGK